MQAAQDSQVWTFFGHFGQKGTSIFREFPNPRNHKAPHCGASRYGAGTRRTVCFDGARFFGRLEFGGKFGVPQLVTINKSASYSFLWNRTGALLASSNSFNFSRA